MDPESTFTPPGGFTERAISATRSVWLGRLPASLCPDDDAFDRLWGLHPPDQPVVTFGEEQRVAPRWHAAFGRDYGYDGFIAEASPAPELLRPYLDWVHERVDPRINGLLVNWYDAARQHRIAPHRDDPRGRVLEVPILTISLGAPRTMVFQVRQRREEIEVTHGTVVLFTEDVNRAHAHAVPHRDGDQGRRISITCRAFE